MTTRRLSKEIDILGYRIPANTRFFLGLDAMQNDPKFTDQPEEFLPERWSPEEVAKRKGTEKEIIDHKLASEPFGYGPRMCLGARIAKIEIRTYLAQLLRDWRITISPNAQPFVISDEMTTMTAAKPFPKFDFETRQKK